VIRRVVAARTSEALWASVELSRVALVDGHRRKA